MQVAIETFFQLGNIFHTDDPTDADLLALLLVSEWSGHAEGLYVWDRLLEVWGSLIWTLVQVKQTEVAQASCSLIGHFQMEQN